MDGRGLREVRRKRGLSQHDLAEAVGATQPTVSSWERGRSAPAAEFLPKLARALDLTVEELPCDRRIRSVAISFAREDLTIAQDIAAAGNLSGEHQVFDLVGSGKTNSVARIYLALRELHEQIDELRSELGRERELSRQLRVRLLGDESADNLLDAPPPARTRATTRKRGKNASKS